MDNRRYWWYSFIERFEEILEDLKDNLLEAHHPDDEGSPHFHPGRDMNHIPEPPPLYIPSKAFRERKPIIEVYMDEEVGVTVIAEAPGIGKEDVKIDLSDERLELWLHFNHRWYRERISLPSPVREDVEIEYNNGILQVRARFREGDREAPSHPR